MNTPHTLDPRLAAFRAGLADIRLAEKVPAERYVAGTPAIVTAQVADVLSAPKAGAGLQTQFLAGAPVAVFDTADGFAWVQGCHDGYVGYVSASDLSTDAQSATHRVIAPRTFLYSGPDLRMPRKAAASLGAEFAVVGQAETRGTGYCLLSTGEAVISAHLAPIGALATDYVAVAETLENTPYLWGGASAFGIDCSGLVQLAMRMTGRDVQRDSDMQAAGLGAAFDPGPDHAGPRRGDLVFWKGHVAIMTSPTDMIHANGHTMLVSREPLAAAVERIAYLYGGPTGFRRP